MDSLLTFLTAPLRKEDKDIYLSRISAIQLRNANAVLNGFIEFSFLGGHEGQGGILKAALQENTVVFTASQEPAFVAFKRAVEERLAPPAPSAAPTTSSTSSQLADLEKLASLRDRGILTEEEFLAKKKQILG